MCTRIVETRTLRTNIVEQGDGPLMLLCHGFPETAHAWRHQIRTLAAAGFRAVAPDMRGYGLTESPSAIDAYTVIHLVGDMIALLDALEAQTAIIVGNDWGATVAWQAAQMRPDRFRGVVAIGVPMMGQPPVPPTRIFPQTDDAQLYTLYFQDPGVAEAELERDIPQTLRKILFAASGNAGARQAGDQTPNPFGMVSRRDGLLSALPDPGQMPDWLTAADLDAYTGAFTTSGFRGGLNYYRNLDRNWQLQASLAGAKVEIPALFVVGERDPGLSMPGMHDIIDAMPALVPRLTEKIIIPGSGHWLPQERPDRLNDAIIKFARHI
ncbi:epoxide hydrolase [Bosea sp. Root483D1]|uniref:alpha/beta fold hydrolase n=1 Tax=Bosea sp. Root483D1 TaxID=1736544 RepID=UPI00070F7E18|nr:alpha/beta hydrolase [Bosea sp. Root483D1]KRE17568.1 epoxide hydrolase [Bosea sp. Root483D1]